MSVFREDGTFTRTIGQGKLQYPTDVLVHSSGLVYVAEWGNHCVAVFSQEGELVRTFGSQGGGKGEFKCPLGVAVSPDDHHLYVSDSSNHRLVCSCLVSLLSVFLSSSDLIMSQRWSSVSSRKLA